MAAQQLAQQRQDLLRLIGIQLLNLSQIAYVEKSQGRTGSDGIRWKPLDPKTIARKLRKGRRNDKRRTTKSGKIRPAAGAVAIGVDSGLQRASASPGYVAPDGRGGNVLEVAGSQVTVGYGRSYSQYFDAVRPLLPERLPPAWQRRLEELAAQHGQAILDQAFGSA